jgi:hypothetical protein
MSVCRGCGAAIEWAETAKNGKPIPLDAKPDEAGNLVVVGFKNDGTRIVAVRLQPSLLEGSRFMPHHATCPNVSSFRR